jgi:hypothetical protein
MTHVVRNEAELRTALMSEIRKAMTVVNEKALADMEEETWGFYSGTEPKIYERTGALGDTPRTTALQISGNSVSFRAFLDMNHRYTTGKYPTMRDVLNLANYGTTNSSVGYLRRNVGHPGFWERANTKMYRSFNDTLSRFFIRR